MKNVHCSHHYLYFSQCSTVASVFVVVQLTTNWYLMTDTVIHLQHHAVGILKNCTGASLQWIITVDYIACMESLQLSECRLTYSVYLCKETESWDH